MWVSSARNAGLLLAWKQSKALPEDIEQGGGSLRPTADERLEYPWLQETGVGIGGGCLGGNSSELVGSSAHTTNTPPPHRVPVNRRGRGHNSTFSSVRACPGCSDTHPASQMTSSLPPTNAVCSRLWSYPTQFSETSFTVCIKPSADSLSWEGSNNPLTVL